MIGLLAIALYLPGAWWGLPHATSSERTHSWGVDDETPLGPLVEVRGIRSRNPDRNLGYPLMHPFLVAAAYTPYLGVQWMTGGFTAPTSIYPYGLADPVGSLRILALIANLVSVLLAAGIVVAAYHIGATWWEHRTGVWAALFVMTTFPMFYYARTGNVDVPVLFFLALTTLAYVQCVRFGFTVRRAIWLGIWAGLSLATKESALGFLVGIPFGLLLAVPDKPITAVLTSREFWRSSAVGLAAALVALAIGSGFAVDPERYLAHLAFLSGRLESLATAGTPVVATHPYTVAGHMAWVIEEVKYLIDSLNPAGFALALGGMVALARTGRRQWLVLLPGVSYLLYMFLTVRVAQLRYVMPLAFILAFCAARFVSHAWQGPSKPINLVVRYAGVMALLVALLHGASLTHAMVRDSRYDAAAWLAARAEPGDVVEYFGANQKLPPLGRDVVARRSIPYRGMYDQPSVDEAAVDSIVRGWHERRPSFVLLVPDHTSGGQPFSFTLPPQLFRSLEAGRESYQRAAVFQTPPLVSWLLPPDLDYPTVNPPIRIYTPSGSMPGGSASGVESLAISRALPGFHMRH